MTPQERIGELVTNALRDGKLDAAALQHAIWEVAGKRAAISIDVDGEDATLRIEVTR